MTDISKAPFEWESRPQGISWVDKLNATQAFQQCNEWKLLPAETLEQNRVILKNYLRQYQKSTEGLAKQPDHAFHENREEATPPAPLVENKQDENESNIASRNSESNNNEIQTQSSDWLGVIQATASAVGQSIASALAAHQTYRETPPVHTRLPRAIYDLITALPNSSGTDSQNFLKFLIGAEQVFELNLIEEKQTLIAILPKTTGQLRTIWATAITQNISYAKLHKDIITTFLPDRAKQQLISEVIYRVQRPNEALIDFITNIKESARVLMPPSTDILDIIITGINSSTRARLAGFTAPRTVEELLALIPRLEVIRNIESAGTRQGANYNNREFNPDRRREYSARTPNTTYAQARGQYHRPYQNNSRATPPAYPFRPNSYAYAANRPSAYMRHNSGNIRPPFHQERPWQQQRYGQADYRDQGTQRPSNQGNANRGH